MKYIYNFIVISLLVSCAQKLIEKPENLIDEGKMENILYDLAIMNAAKNTNIDVLKRNNIKVMDYLYVKYEIDSLQFVKSNEYYAAIPIKYQEMYKNVEARLTAMKENFALIQKQKDSLKRVKDTNSRNKAKTIKKTK